MTALSDDAVLAAVRSFGAGGCTVEQLAAKLFQPGASYLGDHLARLWRRGRVFYGKDGRWRQG